MQKERENNLRVIRDLRIRPTSLNLGLEEAIARYVSIGYAPPTVRFWRNEKSVIIGRSQRVGSEVNLSFCEERNIPVFRRPSGGGTVVHHTGNLNYSIYLPRPLTSDVEESSLRWNELAGSTLENLEIPFEKKENGIFVRGRKISGSAQSRRWGLLHHGTMLLKGNKIMERMDSILKAGGSGYGEEAEGVLSRPSPVGELESMTKDSLIPDKLADLLAEKLSKGVDLDPVKGKIKKGELQLAARLKNSKYARLKAKKPKKARQ